MEKNYGITAHQLFSMFFLIQVITALTYSPKFSESEGIWDFIISAAVSFVVTFILLLPSYLLYKKFPGGDMFFGKLGKICILLYSVYFLCISCYTVSILKVFVKSVMPPDVPVFLIALILTLGGIYSSSKGIHSIARSATIIFFIIGIALIFILFSLFSRIENENLLPFFRDDMSETSNGSIYIISRNFALPIIAIILPYIQGNKERAIIVWNAAIHLFSAVIVLVVVGVLGKYLETQSFPVYAATRMAEIGVFRRLDVMYVGVFVMGLFTLLSIVLYFFLYTTSEIKHQTVKEIYTIVGIILVLVFGTFIPSSSEFYYFIFNRYIILFYTLTVTFVLPSVVLVKNIIIKKMGVSKNEKNIAVNG